MPRMPHEQVKLPALLVGLAVLGLGLVGLFMAVSGPEAPGPALPVGPAAPAPVFALERVLEEPAMEPWGVEGDARGRLFVADRVTDDVLAFDAEGHLTTSARSRNPGVPDLLLEPTNMAWDEPRGRLYVADSGHARVLVFDGELRLTGTRGGPGEGPGQFTRPVGLSVDPAGRLAVVDVDDGRLQIFDADGTFEAGRLGAELSMTHLWDAAWQADGGLVLTSALGGIVSLGPDLKPRASLADRGVGPGLYLFTTGVSCRTDGTLLVCGKTQGKIMVVTPPSDAAPRGTVVTELSSLDGPLCGALEAPMLATYGTLEATREVRAHMRRTIRYPMDVASLGDGRFAVAERGNHRVVVFRPAAP